MDDTLKDILVNVQQKTEATEVYISWDNTTIVAVSSINIRQDDLYSLLLELGTDEIDVQCFGPKTIRYDILKSLDIYHKVYDRGWL
jgi:hypothetical protein